MFLFAPPVQPVLPVWSKKDVYFPVRRALLSKQSDVWCLPEDALFCIADGLEETVHTANGKWQTHAILVAAFGSAYDNKQHCRLCDSIWGWAAGVLLYPQDPSLYLQSHIVVSFLKPHTATPKPMSVENWLYRNNDKLLSQATLDEEEFASLCARTVTLTGSIQRGDLLIIPTSSAFAVAEGCEICAGVSGVGSVKIQLNE